MVERLGDVLYWTGCAAAIAVAGLFVLAVVDSGRDDWWIVAALGAAYSAGCWVLGRALRYILAGR